MTDHPRVYVEPSVRFGYPHINGVSTDAIAGMVWAGESVAVVADDYGMTRAEVLVACWFEARHGPSSTYRSAWKPWAEAAGQAMWNTRTVDYDAIPDPPSREEVTRRGTA